MRNKELLRLVFGFRKFRGKYFSDQNSVYNRLSTGQTPKTLIIGCSDSRVDPAIISSASPGELFVVRNVANLVPPYETTTGFHGVSAAIEFAVVNLRVENIIILGHRQCGGIRALMLGHQNQSGSFVDQWMKIAVSAKEKVLASFKDQETPPDEDTLCRHCEMESIHVSLRNLMTFPFIKAAVEEKRLELHGCYFDLESGKLFEYDHAEDKFKNLEV